MSETHSISARTVHRLQDILERSALPLLLFSIALFSLLLTSWFTVLPRFATLTFDNARYSPTEILSLESTLQAQVVSLEQQRTALVLPQVDPALQPLLSKVRNATDVRGLLAEFAAAGARSADADKAVVIRTFSYDDVSGMVKISGDVRNVGTRSLTVLAAFTEEIEKLPFVSAVQRPAFSRIDDPVIGPLSPFTFTFHVSRAPHS